MTALQCVMGYPRGWGDHSPHPPGTLPITLAADTKKENEVRNDHTVFYPRCVNFLTEISNYTWAKDKFGNKTGKPIDDFNHLMDAMRYAMEDIQCGPTYSFD